MNKTNERRHAFSLAEMLIVMLIVSVFLAAMMPIMTKRKKTVPEPSIVSSTVPVGTITSYVGTTNPQDDSWLLCNGQHIDISKYPVLYGLIGTSYGGSGSQFYIPDLRGLFVRGLDDGKESPIVDPDAPRQIGKFQDSANKSHHHKLYGSNWAKDFKGLKEGGAQVVVASSKIGSLGVVPVDISTGGYQLVVDDGGTESRPKNIALNYIIKAK